MAKHTLKISRCSTARFLKYVWPFYNIMHERVKRKLDLKTTYLIIIIAIYYPYSFAIIPSSTPKIIETEPRPAIKIPVSLLSVIIIKIHNAKFY